MGKSRAIAGGFESPPWTDPLQSQGLTNLTPSFGPNSCSAPDRVAVAPEAVTNRHSTLVHSFTFPQSRPAVGVVGTGSACGLEHQDDLVALPLMDRCQAFCQ